MNFEVETMLFDENKNFVILHDNLWIRNEEERFLTVKQGKF